MELAVIFITFIASIHYGLKKPTRIIHILIWVFPYLAGGNAIFGWIPPKIPLSITLGFSIIIIGLFKINKILKVKKLFALTTFFYLLIYCGLVTCLGLVVVNNDFLAYWSQPPLIRAINSYLNEVFFWLLPIFCVTLSYTERSKHSHTIIFTQLVKSCIYSGFFYSSLGMIQFLASSTVGVDIFPIVRGAGSEGGLQSVAAGGISGRINSICGEPRYLSAYTNIWFALITCFGKKINIKSSIQFFGSILFILTMLLSGSRTGIFGVIATLGLIGIFQLFGFVKILNSKQISIFLMIGLIFNLIIAQPDSVLMNRLNPQEESIHFDNLTIGEIKIPMEFQDLGSLNLTLDNPISFIFGLGSGLWQYGFNPSTNLGLVAIYGKSMTLESVRPNLGLLHRFSSYGFLGICIMIFCYWKLFNSLKIGLNDSDAREIIAVLIIFSGVVQMAKLSDSYAHLVTILMITFVRVSSSSLKYKYNSN